MLNQPLSDLHNEGSIGACDGYAPVDGMLGQPGCNDPLPHLRVRGSRRHAHATVGWVQPRFRYAQYVRNCAQFIMSA